MIQDLTGGRYLDAIREWILDFLNTLPFQNHLFC